MGGHSERVDAFDLRGLALQLRLELAYSIQARHDERTVRLIPMMINRTMARTLGVSVEVSCQRSTHEARSGGCR